MCHYLDVWFWSKNEVRISSNDWSKGATQYLSLTVCHLFSLPFCVFPFLWQRLSPLCQSSDWMPGLGMNTSYSAFSCFAPSKCFVQLLCPRAFLRKTRPSDLRSLFLLSCKIMCALWVNVWKENRLFPVLQRAKSQDALFLVWSQKPCIAMDDFFFRFGEMFWGELSQEWTFTAYQGECTKIKTNK